MGDQELLYKIWDTVNEVKTDVAVVKDRQDEHIRKHDEVAKSHYKLKNDFTEHKTKFVWVSGLIGSFFGAVATFILNLILGKH